VDNNRRGWWLQILTSIATSLAVMFGAWLTVQGDVTSSTAVADASRLESAFKRIEYLETDMKEQQIRSSLKIAELTSQIYRLQATLDEDLDFLSLFEVFMDGLPFEAWLKGVEYVDGKPTFPMILINRRYEESRGVSRIRYAGLTDEEVWGADVQKDFRTSDLHALLIKSGTINYQEVVINGKTVRQRVVKVYLEVVDGFPMIFGMAITP
jgi:hypothetical protein